MHATTQTRHIFALAIGTTLMLLECSKVGARIDIGTVPRPDGADLLRWLTAFPSYGFILSVRHDQTERVLKKFRARELTCAVIGEVTAGSELWLSHEGEEALLWDTARQPFITAREASHA